MDRNNIIESAGFYFIHNFDSGNLGHVERVPTDLIGVTVNQKTNLPEKPDYEFNLWTRPDCAGTEYENGNRTWFYFGIQAAEPNVQVRLNLINLNKQGKMYNQGMAPVTRTLPGKPQWERIRDRPIHSTDDNTFTLSFKYRTAENPKATTFFAFTYPYSFAELQIALNSIDLKMLPLIPPQSPDDIYYSRECLIYSLEGRRVDLLTLSSFHGITSEREEKLQHLFPDNQDRPFKFQNKKVIFMSARVHPGETPSSFVFNGFLNLLLTRTDPTAIQLRKLYVFKMIPFLNPDGVARGHYRTDTRGVNLNRVYLNPSLENHPTVYASRALIRYYHFGYEKEDICEEISFTSRSMTNICESVEKLTDIKKKKSPTLVTRSNEFCRKEKLPKTITVNRSSGPTKPLPDNRLINTRNEAVNLADQVYELKLQEMTSQTSEVSRRVDTTAEDTSLLNENMLRSCLGSHVRLSTSEELKFSGSNPLKPLRETLKNSISLLMDSTTSTEEGCEAEGRAAGVRTGWCRECRTAPQPRVEAPTYHTIEEYREHQRQQFDEQERKLHDAELPPHGDNVYFCTNCFKRYIVTEVNGETGSPPPDTISCLESPLTSLPRPPASSGDALAAQHSSCNEETVKIPPSKQPKKKLPPPAPARPRSPTKEPDSGLFLYIDLHGHASKKGIFMYGNYFEDAESSVECMLLPRIMSLNNLHFHFSSCNFTERNMYLKDRRDGMSREGSGRVAVLKATGLVRSYTLECNYNTGRLVNVLPPPVRDQASPPPSAPPAPPTPPKYTPHIYEEMRRCRSKNPEYCEELDPMQVGRSLGASILDLTGQHPNSRVPCSEHRTLAAVREWLRTHTRAMRPQLTMSRLRPKTSPTRPPIYARTKPKVTDERKENAYTTTKTETERRRSPPVLAQRSGHDIINTKFAKKNEPVKTSSRTRYLAENEPKPKTLSTKRKNILAVRKPIPTKTQITGVVKAKVSRRSADDMESPRASVISAKLSKRSFTRSIRAVTRSGGNRNKPIASSSSDDMISGNWEDVAGGTVLSPQGSEVGALAAKRRSFPNPSPSRLKKIRLKTGL